ncbi:hypothetical protein [Sphingomonas oleivorans]|uniref:hypothetical protein n=1 Tax=Sphingomonas oleivorans TaxID=1735121 RepID=UPI0013FD3FFB|nr:hypothetical protein [Sphingomonas oleivorans]
MKKIDPTKSCGGGSSREIVVCGSRGDDERYRLQPLPSGDFEAKPIIARTGVIDGVTGDMHVESKTLGPGVVSNRMMIRLTKSF